MGKGGNPIKGVARLHQQWTGVDDQANAAGRAARAAEYEARRQRGELITEGRRIESEAMKLAEAGPQELRAFELSLQGAEKQLEQDSKLLAAIDPALMEASGQVLKLLRGEQSGVGNAMGNDRARQREALVNTLRQQLGPGAETSTAGMKALSQFDSESATLGANNQSNSLATLFGVINSRPGMEKGVGLASQAGANYGGIATRMANTKLNAGNVFMQAMVGGNAGVNQTVGSEYTADLIRGRGQQQDHKTGVEFMSSFMGGKTGGGK